MPVRTAKRIVEEYTEQALDSAKALGLSVRKEDLARFVAYIQQDRANWIRNKSKYETVMLIYNGNERCYAVYSKTHKVITRFLSEQEARVNRGDPVWFRQDGVLVQGKVVYVLARYDNPKRHLERIQRLGLDVSELEQGSQTLRPQFSYIVAVEGKAFWPPASDLRKDKPEDAN